MALAKSEIDGQILANGGAQTLAIQPSPRLLPQALEAAPSANVASYNPKVQIKGNGIRGWLRAFHIIWTFTLYHLFVYAYHHGWFIGKKDESEERHLQWQGEWLSRQLLKLGPTFIKIGQSVSTRADLLPLAYIKELSKLQDNVPAFDHEVAMQIIESELGQPIDVLFAEIGDAPIAAASLGQVYQARLHSGEVVAVKVQRPNLEGVINFDLAVLRQIARFMMRFPQVIRGIDWEGILGEFATVVFEEMDYVQEGHNAETFRANFRKWREIYVPTIHWSHSSMRVLTMEFIGGAKVLDLQTLRDRGVNPPDVIKLIARTYLKQLLEDGYFHADPHPGNLRVMEDGRLAFFDFGMVGRISSKLQSQLIDAFFHIVEKDVKGLTQDLINLGFLAPTVDTNVIKPVVEKLFTDYFNLKLGEIRFKELTYELAEVIYEYPFRIPPHFTYVMRAIMTLEGIGIAMDPNFSFFDVAKPFAKEFMIKREGKYFRDMLIKKLVYGEDNEIQWGKMWKLAKIAIKSYWDDFVGESVVSEQKDFTGKVVLVTGAAQGIGRVIAQHFAERGARVAVHYNTNRVRAEKTLASLPCDSHSLIQADITNPEGARQLVETVVREQGRLDVLVNNAAIFEAHPIAKVSYEDWQASWLRTLNTNLIGAANASFCAARQMIEQGGGRIVNISSRGAFRGEPDAPAYGASKAALNSMSQSMAQALAPHNIFVYVVAPGFVETERVAHRLEGTEGEGIRNQSPLKRVARPEEVARTVLFLASEGTDFLTGGIVDVNGASYLRT